MNAQAAIKKLEKAGATVTMVNITESTVRYVAKFDKRTVTFDPDSRTGKVDAFAIPYSYDDANQSEMCFFRYTVKSAIECATR